MAGDTRLGQALQGRYRIVERIGEGGMGIVYLAERLGIGRQVAIKFLHPKVAGSRDARARFEGEARAASRLDHPSCVGVIDFGVADGAPYIVMELVRGRTLRALLADGPLPVPRALELARQLLAGLAHAHAHGVIHRDLKPENVLVWTDALGDHAQLTDFGLAKRLDASAPAISAHLAIGTPSYMAPEQTLGLPVDARSDVYGAGVLVFEMLSGRKPFRGGQPFETMRLQREAPVPTFDEVAPELAIPPEIEGVVRRALAKAPEARYPSASRFARALEGAVASAYDRVGEADVTELLAASGGGRRWSIVLAAIGVGVLAVIALRLAQYV